MQRWNPVHRPPAEPLVSADIVSNAIDLLWWIIYAHKNALFFGGV